MEPLLAQSPTDLAPWLQLVASNGMPAVFMAVVLYLIWKYVPGWVQSNNEFRDRIAKCTEGLDETLRATQEHQKEQHQRTHKALAHIAEAATHEVTKEAAKQSLANARAVVQ